MEQAYECRRTYRFTDSTPSQWRNADIPDCTRTSKAPNRFVVCYTTTLCMEYLGSLVSFTGTYIQKKKREFMAYQQKPRLPADHQLHPNHQLVRVIRYKKRQRGIPCKGYPAKVYRCSCANLEKAALSLSIGSGVGAGDVET